MASDLLAREAPPEQQVGTFRRYLPDVLIAAGYLGAALYLVAPMLGDIGRASPAYNPRDHEFFLFVLAYAARLVTDGGNPFFTDLINTPDGISLMANTGVLGFGLPLAPVTLLAGPHVTYIVAMVVGLAGTAFGWYWVFSRRLVQSRLAAVIGGAFCAFAPGIVTHTQGHINWTAHFLLPFIVDRLFRLAEPGRFWRQGLILGLLMSYQIFINEEALFFAGLGSAIFGLTYAAQRWARVRPIIGRFFAGLGSALLVVGVLVAYPLWVQFTGPGSYRGVPEFVLSYGNDLASFISFSAHSLAGPLSPMHGFAANPSEDNAHFGVPLTVLFFLLVGWLVRTAAAVAAAVTALLFALLSLGPVISVNGRETVAGPWKWLSHLPLFDSVVPTRLSLIMVPCIGLLLALAVERLRALAFTGSAVSTTRSAVVLGAGFLVLSVAVVPILPRPLEIAQLKPVPTFISSGSYRSYLGDGGSMLVVPGRSSDATGMRWAAERGIDFKQPFGYFLVPDPAADGRARFGSVRRPSHQLLTALANNGVVPEPSAKNQARFREDLAYWQVSLIVLSDTTNRYDAFAETITVLLGQPGRSDGGVLMWDL